ncbi:ATP-grasp domain-containing protein [Myroides pelagicus]|uniref:ATP-grasp domain-containing protein n=1 Tax=Myroides pelagicus TaxID=270914 RepID=A0A7K1GI42_9FLAO|nr:ATP-grasp domain-containing protein [Myroides pelagicus]MTH28460.1 ATP-grasp domain-containing protein [Myroides pelagicus]
MRKILFLGGSYAQVPAIKRAKEKGYYVITADYLPNNPGHFYSDEYYNVSTTDKEAVLSLATLLTIDGILAYASDPGAPTAAYVATILGLQTSPLKSIEILGKKHLWRKFLNENGFNVPKTQYGLNILDFNFKDWSFPLMVKPVDSSGSKGVIKINNQAEFEQAFYYAKSFSRNGIIIVEEFINKIGCQIGGDGFFGKDRLEFVCFGDQYVDFDVNPYVPSGMAFPSDIDSKYQKLIKDEINRALTLLGVSNLSFNLEVMIDSKGCIYLMEIGPRNGGNYIPQTIEYLTGISLVDLALTACLMEDSNLDNRKEIPKVSEGFGYYAIHSNREGIFHSIEYRFSNEIEIIEEHLYLKEGCKIKPFNGSNHTIGILILKFKTKDLMKVFYNNPSKYINIIYE